MKSWIWDALPLLIVMAVLLVCQFLFVLSTFRR